MFIQQTKTQNESSTFLPLLWASSCDAELTATLQSEQYSRRLAFSSSVSGSASWSGSGSEGGLTFDPSSPSEAEFVSELAATFRTVGEHGVASGDGAAEGLTDRLTGGGAAPEGQSVGRWLEFIFEF